LTTSNRDNFWKTPVVALKQVRDVIERHNSVKVNTVFDDEFEASDKCANKSINMRNYELLNIELA